MKDFVNYGSPCLECGNKLDLSFNITFRQNDATSVIPLNLQNDGKLLANLKITYKDALIMVLDPKTNKFAVTIPEKDFLKYLQECCIRLIMTCKCYSVFLSDKLDFDTKTFRLAAFTVASETMTVRTPHEMYRLSTYYGGNTSELEIYPMDSISKMTETMVLPILPRSKFKNKSHFLEKIKTYLIFS